MIPKDCKRLAEVDFPIAVVSKHSAREKSIRHGHPSTLHLWWARRPLAACRAMLLALLLPDPCDSLCPKEFNEKARALLPKVQGNTGPEDIDLRKSLLRFIGDFSNWDLSSNQTYLEVGRGLVKAAHSEETPLVVDPFAGGGSIPLEALRLGCETFASDLNPVSCLILKVMLEDIPRNGPELAEKLRRVGKEIKDQAEKELAEFYPLDPDGATPIAYLWARTVRCEAPNCGAEIPLVRSFWLCKKANRRRALRWKVVRLKGKPPQLAFEVFEPRSDSDVPVGTVKNGRAMCAFCSSILASPRVQAQLKEKHGGTSDARMLAVVCVSKARQGRSYRIPNDKDLHSAVAAESYLNAKLGSAVLDDLKEPLSPIRPSPNARGVSAPTRYGANSFKDLFASRQRLALLTFSEIIAKCDQSPSIKRLLAFALDKMAIQCNAHCRWKATGESLVDMFGRHAITMVWDYAESVCLGFSTGGWSPVLEWLANAICHINTWAMEPGQVSCEDACISPIPDETAKVWFTDPPYYDNIPYADLSDLFYVWLKRSLSSDPVLTVDREDGNQLTPKEKEAVWNYSHIVDGKPKGPDFFEKAIARASQEGKRILASDGLGSVVFAHKTTEGWEALLTGIVKAGWIITASWPIDTEMTTRVSARDSASLSTSVHLVCRPRPEDAPVGDWGDVVNGLPKRVGDWMERLQNEGVRGADLVFACIGPALEIFSRYSRVETADGREVKLAEYLEKVWEVVGRTALEHVLGTPEAQARNSAAGALEEDARLTALFLWTLQSTNGGNSKETKPESEDDEVETDEEAERPKKRKAGYSLIFDVVRRFAQPLGIHLPEWEGRIIETEKGVVRLLSVRERSKQLFGEESGQAFAEQLEKTPAGQVQISLFPRPEKSSAPQIKGRGRKARKGAEVTVESVKTTHEATTLDRVHAAMLLQSSGRTNALRALLKAEQDRGADFLRLANALSALYPRDSEEKRLLDAMLLAVPR
jgi:putative DNA methylase